MVFSSKFHLVVLGDGNTTEDLFLFDRDGDRYSTRLVSHSSAALDSAASGPPGSYSQYTVSADGRWVAFSSSATDLVPGQTDTTNSTWDVFLFDRDGAADATKLVSRSVASPTSTGNGYSFTPVISANGRYVAFTSSANDLVAGDRNAFEDAFLYEHPDLGKFHTLPPCRIVDTRNSAGPLAGPILTGGVARTFPLASGTCGIPAGASAVSLNATAVGATAGGYLTVHPSGTLPGTYTISFNAAQTRANNLVIGLAADGSVVVQATVAGGGQVHLILDVNGYFF